MNSGDPFGLVGQVIDSQLRIDQVVGEGGFSVVYRGEHMGLGEPVAVKCLKLPPTLGQGLVETFVKRFRDESRILYRLSQGNLNIVRSIAAGTTFSPTTGLLVPYMALEWLEGRSLAADFAHRRRQGQRGRPLTEVIKVFTPSADALGFAHAQGVVHRDLNPGNFFFTKTPQGEKLKVLDFGVAKVMHDSTLNLGTRAQTLGQVRIFAPAYGAPEQFDESFGQAGPATDVYGFALVLMEAMRDAVVNEGTNVTDYMRLAIDRTRRPTPRALGFEVPDDLEKVFMRATALDPRARWQNVGEFWGALTFSVEMGGARKAAPRPPPAAMGRTLPQGSGAGATKLPQIRPILKPPAPRPAAGARPGTPLPPRIQPAAPPVNPPRLAALDSEDDIATRVGERPQFDSLSDQDVTRVGSPLEDIMRDVAQQVPAPPADRPRPPSHHPADDGGTLVMASPFVQIQQMQAQQQAQQVSMSPRPPPVVSRPPQQGPYASHSPQPPPVGFPPHFQQRGGPTPAPPQVSRAPGPPHLAPGGHVAPPAPVEPEPLGKAPLLALGLAMVVLLVGLAGLAVFAFTGKSHKHPAGGGTTDPSGTPVPVGSGEPPPIASVAEDDGAPVASADPVEADAVAPPATTTLSATAPAFTAPPALTPAPAPALAPAPAPNTGGGFNDRDARARLAAATATLAPCKRQGGKTGPGSANVTFTPDGAVLNITLDPPYAWTPEGDCIAQQIRRVRLEPFKGPSQTLKHGFVVPE